MTDDSKYGSYYCPRCLVVLGLNSDDPADWTCDQCGALFDADTWLDEAKLREKRAREHEAWNQAIASGLIIPPKVGG